MSSKFIGKTLSTKQKILFLQKYINSRFPKLLKHHPENITGLRIDKKVKNGIEQRHYSIIFHVEKKIGHSEVKEIGKLIPPFLNIKFPDGKTRKIKTDVEETGKFEFHLKIGSKIIDIHNNSQSIGLISLFLIDNKTDSLYAITCYHVVAFNLMQKNQFEYDSSLETEPIIVNIKDQTKIISGQFEIGKFTDDVDVAFIKINLPCGPLNALPNNGYVVDKFEDSFPLSLEGEFATIYSSTNPGGVSSRILTISSPFNTKFNQKIIKNTLLLSQPLTSYGDSGSLVTLTKDNSILGIVTGGDTKFTYVIPYFQIKSIRSYNIL